MFTLNLSGVFCAENPKVAFEKGMKKLTKNDLAGAIKEFDVAISLKPDYLQAYYNRGTAKMNLSDLPGALADYTKVIQIEPTFYKAFLNRAAVKGKQKDYEGGIQDLDELLETRPNYALAYGMRAQMKKNNKDLEAACEDYKRAIELGDKNSERNYGMLCKGSKPNILREQFAIDFATFGLYPPKKIENQFEIIFLKGGENESEFTIKATVSIRPNLASIDMQELHNNFIEITKGRLQGAQIQELDRDFMTEFSFILYQVEMPAQQGKEGAFQYVYFIKGYDAVYETTFHYSKKPEDEDVMTNCQEFLKSKTIVYK
jgi:tetratricopeptide (TPR) repeat protein